MATMSATAYVRAEARTRLVPGEMKGSTSCCSYRATPQEELSLPVPFSPVVEREMDA